MSTQHPVLDRPKARLTMLNGDSAGSVLELTDGTLTVGRDNDNTIIIDDATVSRHHAELLVFSPGIIVRDLDSANGTLVHDRWLLDGQYEVLSGQMLLFGLIAARLDVEPVRPMRGATTAILEYRDYMQLISQRPSLVVALEHSGSRMQLNNATKSGLLTSLITYPATLIRSATAHFNRPGR